MLQTPVRLTRRAPIPEWPHRRLDVGAMLRAGWRPRPFGQFVLKVQSRCNLACSYCYVYRSADQTWRHRPVRMSDATVVRVAERIAEHVQSHGLCRVQVVAHGGEPLLNGPPFFEFLATTLRAALPEGTDLDLSVQTNGTLIDEAILDTLRAQDIRVGVSLDGAPAAHDGRRFHAGGRGSHRTVTEGLTLLRTECYRHLFAGLLCVVDPESDPAVAYDHLLSYEPPTIDFLLPHANWSNPPPTPPGAPTGSYGDWLIAVFDRWYMAPVRRTSVRLFDEIIRTLLGLPSRVEAVGLSPASLVVVETDGEIEHVDALKSTFEGAARTGLNVEDHPFDAALVHPQTVARQIGADALARTCRECDIHRVCGGGFYPHRYRQGSGFDNPSVYCHDLSALIRHVHACVKEDVDRLAVARRP